MWGYAGITALALCPCAVLLTQLAKGLEAFQEAMGVDADLRAYEKLGKTSEERYDACEGSLTKLQNLKNFQIRNLKHWLNQSHYQHLKHFQILIHFQN